MFDPHQIPNRLAVAAGMSLLAVLIVPNALARPVDEVGGELIELGSNPATGAVGDPVAGVDASATSFDWTAALVVVLIGLAVLVITFAVRPAAGRRGTQLAAR